MIYFHIYSILSDRFYISTYILFCQIDSIFPHIPIKLKLTGSNIWPLTISFKGEYFNCYHPTMYLMLSCLSWVCQCHKCQLYVALLCWDAEPAVIDWAAPRIWAACGLKWLYLHRNKIISNPNTFSALCVPKPEMVCRMALETNLLLAS